jgi:hypothetical protein
MKTEPLNIKRYQRVTFKLQEKGSTTGLRLQVTAVWNTNTIFQGWSASDGLVTIIATSTYNFQPTDTLTLTISDSANVYYPLSHPYTVSSTFDEQISLDIDKKFSASFTLKDGTTAVPGIKVTISASGMTSQTRITDASGIALFIATASEFEATTAITVTIADPAGIYNETNFSPTSITLSGYSLD